jgi:serine/threonine-protein kinase RsbW
MLELALNAELSSLTTMANAIEGYAADHAIPQAKTMELILALDEVVTNVISYGGLAPSDTIAVTIDLGDDALSAAVEDHGSAFDPLNDAPPHETGSLEERPMGGLGLHILRSIVKELSYQRVDGRNLLIMRLPL